MDRAAFFREFQPCAWTELQPLPQTERTRRFVIPEIDDPRILQAGWKTAERIISGARPIHHWNADFFKALNFLPFPEVFDAFKAALDFYSALAHSATRYEASLGKAVLDAYPAAEIITTSAQWDLRDWLPRWLKAGGILRDGRMIALITDPIWTRLSILGLPHPPFDFDAAVDWRDVRWRDWTALTAGTRAAKRQA